jgi:type IV pilus assembly protein PilQ
LIKPELKDELVNGYIQKLEFEDAINKFAFANDLVVVKEDLAFLLEKKIEDEKIATKNKKPGRNNKFEQEVFDFEMDVKSINDISIFGIDIPLIEVINLVSQEVGVNYFVLSELDENITLNLKNVSYVEFLENILYGSAYTYELDGKIYLIGERQIENLRESKTIKLKFRSVQDILSFIPSNLQEGIEIFEMPELNCLIVSGSEPAINELELFIQDIDVMVPVVLIEVMIISYKKGYTISTGVSAGIGDAPVKTQGTVVPIDMTFGASSINNLLASFNGAGTVNLGRVTPNFYINLKALETDGVVKVRSTPKLSTLNGHEAKMTIGNTEYYLEEKSQIFANQTTTQEKTRQFKPVNADFNLVIFPVVSGDEQITLDITVEQSDFTGTKLAPDAPPDQVKRSFQSMIRIKNEEMILLGGLEEYTRETSGSGVPFLSRIPVIKWFFSSRKKVKSEDKLNIFIKPTVIY